MVSAETAELARAAVADRAEEIADVLEVLRSIARHQGLDWDEVESLRVTKRADRGGFDNRLLLVTSLPADK